ncbi:MAG: rhamnulokinase [Oscillospiraceae bacterium]|nr:rhamnulokinase [Oscillospiraceae bacterium]
MTSQLHLAIDIGASSGRHILGRLEDGIIKLEEIHRFPNGMKEIDGSLCWDVDSIFSEIIIGMKKCAQHGKIPTSIGIDTWGVDYVLIDAKGHRIGETYAYRDSRTDNMDGNLNKCISEAERYRRTGIQKQAFNTINQLTASNLKTPHLLEQADHLLLMPDYLNYRLCGVIQTEYTIASTTGLLNVQTHDWDDDMLLKCGFPRKLFGTILPPGSKLGALTKDIQQAVGFDCTVVMPPSHDTASAFLAVPAVSDNSIYISSGTWSLIGIELDKPITNDAARNANCTNEGGYDYRYRFLKNIMGFWPLQSVAREIGGGISFAKFVALSRASSCTSTFDINDKRLFAPKSMSETIRTLCKQTGQSEPQTSGDFAKCIYLSLAASYASAIKELMTLTGRSFDYINIIGGGSENTYLNELTAAQCHLPVLAGPTEGSALGNIVSQMLAYGQLPDIKTARQVIRHSFDIKMITN